MPEIGDGEALLRVDRVGLTANNVTYAVLGESFRYWDFFPPGNGWAPDWGMVPLWGFADIAASAVDGGVGDRVQQGLGAEVGPGRVDGEPERGGEFVVVGGSLGSSHDAGNPDPVPGQLGGRDRAGGGEFVRRSDQELDGLVEDPGGVDAVGLDAVGELPCGPGDGATATKVSTASRSTLAHLSCHNAPLWLAGRAVV